MTPAEVVWPTLLLLLLLAGQLARTLIQWGLSSNPTDPIGDSPGLAYRPATRRQGRILARRVPGMAEVIRAGAHARRARYRPRHRRR